MRAAARLTKIVLWISSFVLSLVLYLYVQIINPTPTEEIHLLVRAKNLAPGLVFDAEGTPVTYKATGPKDELSRLQSRLKDDPSFIVATADLKSIDPSRVHDKFPILPVTLSVKAPPEFDDVTFTQDDHPLDAAVERQKTSDVKIRIRFATNAAQPANNPDPNDFEASPARLTITGSIDAVDKADPSVIIDPQELERDGIETVPLNISAKLTFIPNVDRVEVRAARRQRLTYVNVVFEGHPASGFRVSNYYVVSPSGPTSTVAVEGPAGLVEKTSTIDATVDISGLSKSFTFEPPPRMPDRLQLIDSPLQIHVDIEKIPR